MLDNLTLRDYQREASEKVFEAWNDHRSTVVVLPTGCGKTVVFGDITKKLLEKYPSQKVMILAHREELINQASEKVSAITGKDAAIEMGAIKADAFMGLKPDIIVSSVQTQITGRMKKFDPAEFSALIIDEAHHATAKSYRKCIEHYFQNPALKLLGVTATPDRADETALAHVFESVAYEYSVLDAIKGGWLVPVKQKLVEISSLDFSKISTCAGDFNQGELSEVLEDEENLHGIASASLQICKTRRAIIFAASVKQAERLSEILNRHREGSSNWVCGKTPKEDRKRILDSFKTGRIQFVVNVGVLTEGFDDSGVEVVVMARPTKSRALYAQMAGRATRPHSSIAALLGQVQSSSSRMEDSSLQLQLQTSTRDAASARRALIAASPKPECLIVDFVGNSGKHKLITTLDILGDKETGELDDEVRRHVKKHCEEAEDGLDVIEDLAETRKAILERKAEDERKRKFIIATAKYSTFSIDPFDIFDIDRPAKPTRSSLDRRRLSFKQRELLRERIKVDPETLSYAEGKALIDEFFKRIELHLASFAQMKVLKKHGLHFPVSFDEASRTISRLKGVRV